MTLTEAIEFGMPCVDLAQDAEWCEVALETMKKYQNLISDDNDWKEVRRLVARCKRDGASDYYISKLWNIVNSHIESKEIALD